VRLAPWGDSIKERVVRRADGSQEQQTFIQRLDQAAGAAMANEFGSLAGKVRRWLFGVPVYRRHPDLADHSPGVVTDNQASDRSQHGMITGLEARADGLYGRVALNSAGQAAVENDKLKYLSPFWWCRVGGQQGSATVVTPARLISAGLTDRPNITGGEALANQQGGAGATPEPQINMERKKLIELLKQFSVTLANEATDEQIGQAIEGLGKRAGLVTGLENERGTLATAKTTAETELASARTQLATEKTRADGLQLAFANERKARIGLVLDTALEAGKITAAQRPQWEQELAADFDGKLKALANEQPKVKTGSQTEGLGARRAAALEGAELTNKVVELANERMAKTGCDWPTAYNGVLKDNPEIAAKMKTPGK
jgi:phage I-like protein